MKAVSDELVYSDNILCAFLSAIVQAFEKYHGRQHYLGQTAMQTLSYFVQVLGVPIPCSFGIYTYGPYSENVTFAIDSLLADDVLKDKSTTSTYSTYRLGENASQIFSKYGPVVEPHTAAIEQVVKALGTLEPNQLQMLARLYFIHERLKQIRRKKPSKKEVVDEFRSVKKDKPDDSHEIELIYSALTFAKLISI